MAISANRLELLQIADDLIDGIPAVARNLFRKSGDIDRKAIGSKAELQQLGEPDRLLPR